MLAYRNSNTEYSESNSLELLYAINALPIIHSTNLFIIKTLDNKGGWLD